MTNRKQWIAKNNPVLNTIDIKSPLTVGNGNFAFSVDVTGLQSLYHTYTSETPLCTMSNWGWHTIPADALTDAYTLDDCTMNRYNFCGREVRYAKSRFPGNEHVYDWLRKNPHKFNLARVGLNLYGRELQPDALSNIHQELHLYTGIIESRYMLDGVPCRVLTACSPVDDAITLHIESKLLLDGMTVDLEFPYGSCEISGSDWHSAALHESTLTGRTIQRVMDQMRYSVDVHLSCGQIQQIAAHHIRITSTATVLDLTLYFSQESHDPHPCIGSVFEHSASWWRAFWEKGGAIDFSACTDPRAQELERRIILSIYLLTINSSGCMPPAETGLICNSWYGKAHLEMHFWHMAWAPLWGHSDLLMRSLPWYHAQLPHAKENAARNGYHGARWPKMVGNVGVDSPSPIAVLLVWQQPHIIVMLELIRRAMLHENPSAIRKLLQEHWPLIKETADFMADYAVYDSTDGAYHIEPPVIPVQERHEPEITRDPSFEVAYWKFGLGIAIQWAQELGITPDGKWLDVQARMVTPPLLDELYIAHANAPDTFTRVATDHPSMLQNFGMLPPQDVNPTVMAKTLHQVITCWDYNSLWGWDFAVMAMTATRLSDPQTAVDQLLCYTNKNTYVASGNNRQITCNDLPLYLPGNGSLLLAAAMMAAGWDGSEPSPGFRSEDGWHIAWDGLYPYF